jgi:Raf kinase inhibitor-like YbhB/YbcL family protein
MAQQLNVADLRISSPAFDAHSRIPERHTADGEDVSPPVAWSGVPYGTKAFAIVVHDPDAPLVDGFTHWVAYGIPGDASGLPEGGGDAVSGTNSFGNAGYGGPAPPPGHGPHTTTSGFTPWTTNWILSLGSTGGRYSSGSRIT